MKLWIICISIRYVFFYDDRLYLTIDSCFFQNGVENLEEYINSTYPVIHENLIRTLITFIVFKKHCGSKKERLVMKFD